LRQHSFPLDIADCEHRNLLTFSTREVTPLAICVLVGKVGN
jgi:hypothetical protein